MQTEDYARKLESEQRHFRDMEEVHDLPKIFHYWSNRYIRPMVEEFGFTLAEDLYAGSLLETAKRSDNNFPYFVSIGSGNGDLEVRLATMLRAANESLIERKARRESLPLEPAPPPSRRGIWGPRLRSRRLRCQFVRRLQKQCQRILIRDTWPKLSMRIPAW